MTKKLIVILILLCAGFYYNHSSSNKNDAKVEAIAALKASKIAYSKGWLKGNFSVLETINKLDSERIFELQSDEFSDGKHITSGKFYYFEHGTDIKKCQEMDFSWSENKSDNIPTTLIRHYPCV
ncbi:hypothetical protein [Photobacterium sanguinicancri]|uniref:hypothetical protein n=1 Tax=Photobacterium sanguinicancri TaxID=875932 RepID=UPI0026E2CB5B|nr:hypothetical protein [Photobacterium sanguinicancri]MDO6501154.1 hypothetical protein [Photobacterium sanguinicancri]